MSVMRFYAIAVVAACLVAAQTPRQGCPALSGTSALFTNTSSTCTQATSCGTDYTTCLAKNTTSCDNAQECIGARFSCLFKAAENTTGCRQLNNVQLSLLKVSSGSQRFNASDAGMSCAASACRWLNETLVGGRGTNCTLDYDVLCQSPIVAVATIVFRGNFSGILADPVKRTAFSNAIRNDFARALRLVVSQIRIKRLFLVGSRRQASQTLVVEIEILGVSASNTDFATTLAAIKANPSSFFSETTASYSALNPGQTLQITGVGVGSASNAFSQGIPTGVATPAPVRSNTTAAPRSNATTTAAPRGSTAAPRTTTTTSGSSLASAILGVVSAAVIALAL